MATPPTRGPTSGQASGAVEAIANRLTRRAVLTARYDADLSRKVLRLLIELEADLRAQIVRINPGGVAMLSARQKRLETLLADTRKSIRSTYRRINNLTTRELSELVEIEATATRAIVTDSLAHVGYTLQARLPTETYLANLAQEQLVVGQPLASWWEKQSADLQRVIHSEIRLGLAAGETVDQLAARISPEAFANRLPNKLTAELSEELWERRSAMLSARRGARTLVITAANAAGNKAREAVYDANADIVTELVHLSRLDSRTSEICIARAGKRWDRSTRQPIGHQLPYATPPLHPRCRSVVVPRIIGGDLPTDQSGEEFFKSLSTEEQDAIFGKGKAAMFRRGEIRASDLVDQSGRPISLKRLREERA